MTDRLFRYSQTSTFLESRSRYKLLYIDGLEKVYPDDVARPMLASDVGNIGHKGLEAIYKGKSPAVAHRAMRMFAEKENTYDTLKCTKQRAYDAVDGWLRYSAQHKLDDGLEVVAVEKRFYIPMGTFNGDEVTLTFEPDLIMRDRYGSLHTFDWKFVEKYQRLASFIGSNRQGLTYSLGIEQVYGQLPVSFALRQINRVPLKTKPTIPADVVTQWLTPEMIAQHRIYLNRILTDMVRLHQEVEAGDNSGAYPNPTYNCANMCSHFDVCCGAIARPPAEVAVDLQTKYRKKTDTL